MCDVISSVCETLPTPIGRNLIDLLASVYSGVHDVSVLQETVGEEALNVARGLCLLKHWGDRQVVLTPEGYLVGNVAKEYTHWVNNGRQMPVLCPPDKFIKNKDVLDLGCSFGRWLWQFQKSARSVLGVEMQGEYIRLGQALAKLEGISCPEIRRGSVEDLALYVAEDSVDFVFVRLVLNHVYVRRTLQQIAGVLRKDGIVWAQVERWRSPFRAFLRKDLGRDMRHKLFAAFAIVNSAVFMTTHRQMSLRVRGRMHSVHKPVYPALSTWKGVFSRAGLTEFHHVEGGVFWVRKP